MRSKSSSVPGLERQILPQRRGEISVDYRKCDLSIESQHSGNFMQQKSPNES